MTSDDQPDKADQTGDTGESIEDAAWRDIVEHFGERAHLDDLDDLDEPEFEDPMVRAAYEDDLDADTIYVEDVERYEPPPPPPLPKTTPDRLMAWIGLLGTPVIVITLLILNWITDWSPPTWLIALLVVGFLGGFGYLVYSMSNEPGDPWDDGARL